MPHDVGSRPDLSGQGADRPALRPADLGAVFCAWQDAGAGKPPNDPRTGRMASVTDPATWGTKAQAQARTALWGGSHPSGIGTMLAPLPGWPGWRVVALDFDSCRDPATGALEWWAEAVVARFATYAEPSPSTRGVHILAAALDSDVEELRALGLIRPDPETGAPGAGRAFDFSGEHRELAFFAERKFLTYTAAPLPGHDVIRPVSLADLEWLLGEHGPEVQAREGRRAQKGKAGAGGAKAERDESGSGHGWHFCLAAFRSGASEEAVRDALAQDGGDAGEWWGRADERQRSRVLARTKAKADRERDALLEGFDVIEATVEGARERDLDAEIAFLLGEAPEGVVSAMPPATPPSPVRSAMREAADRQAAWGDVWCGARHADRLRGKRLYVSADALWTGWTGQRWAALTPEDVTADATATSAALLADAARAYGDSPSPDRQMALRKATALHASAPALERMVAMARSEPGMAVASFAEFNADPYALAVHNGILDLQTGRLRPARPEDRVSMLAGCAFDPDARAPMFESFLATILPDPEVRAFVQRALGYSLTGDVGEERFFVLYGTGANGKSVLGNVLAAVLGEYARSFGAALVTKNRNENEAARMVAALPGVRLAQVDETSPGDVFDAARVKSLASREPLSARRLYAEAFQFQPSHHLWIRTNFLPGSLDASDGFWRRCVPIPFTVQIPEAERVPDLDRRIIREELEGVLAWAARGAVEWARGGLRVPASIRTETEDYRQETDLLGQWLSERTVADPAGEVRAGEAFADFKAFCQDQGVSFPAQRTFGRSLRGRGIKPGTNTARRTYLGFRLRPYAQEGFTSEPAPGGGGTASNGPEAGEEPWRDLL